MRTELISLPFIAALLGVLKHLKENKRICGVVSRGGTFLVEWMIHNGRENPLYEEYDEILAIAKNMM